MLFLSAGTLAQERLETWWGEGGVVERNVWSVFVENIILLVFRLLCIVTLWVTVFDMFIRLTK